jgi:hypothetical protein
MKNQCFSAQIETAFDFNEEKIHQKQLNVNRQKLPRAPDGEGQQQT